MRHYGPADIKRGLDAWREKWPPNVFEFSLACMPPPESGCAAILREEAQKELPPPRCPKDKALENLAKVKAAIYGSKVISE